MKNKEWVNELIGEDVPSFVVDILASELDAREGVIRHKNWKESLMRVNSKLTLTPAEWPVSVNTCPPGPFAFPYNEEWHLGFKTEYRTEKGNVEAYNSVGEYLCIDYDETPVIPLRVDCDEIDY